MSLLILQAEVVDKGLRLVGVMLGAVGLGNAFGVTAGVLERKPPEQIERWGRIGTSVGCLLGFLLMLCVWVLTDRG